MEINNRHWKCVCEYLNNLETAMCSMCGNRRPFDFLYEDTRPEREELEAQLATANAELESMHRELAAKDAEIAEWKRIHAILKKDQLALYKDRTRIIKDLNAKQAIIDEQRREITQLRMWLRLYEWGGGL